MRRWLAVLAVVGLLLAGQSPAEAKSRLAVQLVSVSPTWLAAPAPVSLNIKVNSDTDLGAVSVAVRRSEQPLLARSEIALSRRNQSDLPMQSVGVFTFPELLAGGAEFPLGLPATAFADAKAGAYVLEVQVITETALGRTELLMPYLPGGEVERALDLVTLWPIAADPTLLATGDYLSEYAVDQFGITGSTQAALAAGKARTGLTWLVDPATVAAAQRIAQGGSFQQPEPTDVSPAQQEAAANWLTALNEQISSQPYYQLPYANADVNGLLAKRLRGLLAASLGTGAMTALPNSAAGSAFMPGRGDFGPRTWKWVADRRPALVVVAAKSYPSNTSVYTPSGVSVSPSGTPVLVADQQASSELTNGIQGATAVKARQSLLADMLVLALEQPGRQRVVVLQPRTRARGVTLTAANETLDSMVVPWLNPVSAAAALTRPAATERSQKVTGIRPVFNEMTLRTFWDLERRRTAIDALIGGTVHEQQQIAAELQLTSNLYLSTVERQQHRDAATKQMANLESAVSIMSAGSVVFAGERGVVPITVRNSLTVPVKVAVSAVGEPAVRVTVNSVNNLLINPGKRKSIELDTTFRGSDLAHVRLQLLTTDGKPIGAPVRIQIYSSAYSKAAAWVVYGAFALLLMLVAVNTVRRVRVRRLHRRQERNV